MKKHKNLKETNMSKIQDDTIRTAIVNNAKLWTVAINKNGFSQSETDFEVWYYTDLRVSIPLGMSTSEMFIAVCQEIEGN